MSSAYRAHGRTRVSRPIVWLRRFAIVGAACYVALFAWTGRLVGIAEEAFRNSQHDRAHESLSRAAFWNVRRARVQDALAVVDLSRGRLDEARSHLSRASAGFFFHPSAFGEQRVLEQFIREGMFEPALIYAEHRMELSPGAVTAFHLAAAENALNRLEGAERHLSLAEADASLRDSTRDLRERIAAKRKVGRADYLFDRSGAPLAGIEIASGRHVWLAPDLEPLLSAPAGPRLEEHQRHEQVRLTLDLRIQRAAESALGSKMGALVAIDPRSGALLAAASQDAGRATGPGQLPRALGRFHEPGSIIKMITLAAALRAGLDVDALFPMDCPGWLTIDGVAFRDWTTHRRVESIDEAVAVSCNLAFARLGAVVGRDALDAELRQFGFDGGSPIASDFGFATGRLLPHDTARPNYALARRAVGLDSISITPVHAAMVAAALATSGSPRPPHLIDGGVNALGESRAGSLPSYSPAAPPLPPEAASVLVRTMLLAVTSPDGTARRAAVPGLSAAMKTGTSGENPPGYDALVIGFVPAEQPRLAWALIAQHAGKAELEGARITRAFLESIKAALPD